MLLCLYLLIQFCVKQTTAFILLFCHFSFLRIINIFTVTFSILFFRIKSRRACFLFTFSVFGILCAFYPALHFKDLLVSLCPTEFCMPFHFSLMSLHLQNVLFAVLKLELSFLNFHYNCSQIAFVCTTAFHWLHLAEIRN